MFDVIVRHVVIIAFELTRFRSITTTAKSTAFAKPHDQYELEFKNIITCELRTGSTVMEIYVRFRF